MASPFPARLVNSGSQDETVLSRGNLVVTLTGCANNSTDSATLFQVIVPTDSFGGPLLAAPGISVMSTALPTSPVVTSTSGAACNLASIGYSSGSTLVSFNHPVGSVCSYVVSFPLNLTMHTDHGAISGQVGVNLTNPTLGANGWVLYSGASGSLAGLSKTLELIATTCTLAVKDTTVTLPRLSVSALAGGAGKTAGRTPFSVALNGCTSHAAPYAAKATWAFTEGPDASLIANNAGSPAAGNVYVQMLDSAFHPVANGAVTTVAQVTGGVAASVKHYVQYVAGTGTVVPGNVKGVTTLTLSYE